MSNTKHTAGNWTFKKYSTDFGVYSEEGKGYDIALVREVNHEEEAEANARLISAAPALLDASESCLQSLRDMVQNDMTRGMIMVLENAINKATRP